MALALRKDSPLPTGIDEASPRDQVLARYRQLREISKRHHHKILDCISADAFLHQARRLGLARGKTLILDDMDELNYVHDLVIHTAPTGRSRAIDRYARSTHLVARSDEALVLGAMRVARFAILVIERRHEAAGLIATDLFRRNQVWLVDIGLEATMPEGAMMATRLYTPERFTAGVNVPSDLGLHRGSLCGTAAPPGPSRVDDADQRSPLRRNDLSHCSCRRNHGSHHLPGAAGLTAHAAPVPVHWPRAAVRSARASKLGR